MKVPLWAAIVASAIVVGCETPQAARSVSAPAAPSQASSVIASASPPSDHPAQVSARTSHPHHHASTQSSAPAANSVPALPQSQNPPAENLQTVTVQYVTYHSAVLGVDRTCGIALPPGYSQNSQQRYPVIVLLHGGSGDQTDWFNPSKGNATVTLQQLYAAGKLPLSIVVTPDGNDLRGKSRYHDPEYFDGPNGKVATALGSELVQVLQSRYRTLNQPDFWAIGGLSSGAWGAVNIGLHFPDRYHILFSHSGYFVDRSGAANSPQTYIKTLPAQTLKSLHIYLDAGESDGEYLQASRTFYADLQRLNVPSQLEIFPGSHSWQYWQTHLTDSLTYVGQQFQQALTHPHT